MASRLHEAKYIIRCDASPSGLEGILLYRGSPIAWWADDVMDEGLKTLKATRAPRWQPEFELLAILISIYKWQSMLDCASLVAHGDATAAHHAASKLSAKGPIMNLLAG